MDFFHQYDKLLSNEELAQVVRAREFCEGAFSKSVLAAHLAGDAFPAEWVDKWAAAGMLGLQAKRTHGGLEASYVCKIRVAQEMARHGFAAAFCLNHHQGGVTRLSQTGTAAQIDRLLAPAMRGELLLTTAMSEPSGGSDVSALTTSATPVAGGWSLSGTKAWLTNGLVVGGLIVLARVPDSAGAGEIASFYVPLGEAETFQRNEIMVPGARSFRLARSCGAAERLNKGFPNGRWLDLRTASLTGFQSPCWWPSLVEVTKLRSRSWSAGARPGSAAC